MTRYVADARETLLRALSPELLDALLGLVDERVAAALGERENGTAPTWLTLAEAAEYLRVSPRTAERLIASGRIRSTTLGRRRLLRRDDLDQFAEGGGGGTARTDPPRRRSQA